MPIINGFTVIHQKDSAHELVNRFTPLVERSIILCDPLDSTLVLGSSQTEAEMGKALSALPDYNIVKRRSGGGVVLVGPARQVWIDIFIPKDDPLYVEDIIESPMWLGELWDKVLHTLFPESCVEIHQGRLVGSMAKLICFSGIGPGEVLLDGLKAVGISQRRIRSGTWFYTMLALGNSQSPLYDAFNLASATKASAQRSSPLTDEDNQPTTGKCLKDGHDRHRMPAFIDPGKKTEIEKAFLSALDEISIQTRSR